MSKHELYSYRTASCTHTLSCRIQVLRKRHQLPDKDVARLYRILHIYSLGFHQVVGEVTLHADHRQPLLLAVWRAFSQLWQDALQVSFVPPNSSHIAGSSAPPSLPPGPSPAPFPSSQQTCPLCWLKPSVQARLQGSLAGHVLQNSLAFFLAQRRT